ncbi:MAG: ABC transporter ATP-binding protein, partial [Methylobacter sp.]
MVDNLPPVALEAINIDKSFGALQVLEQVSFKLHQGSFHALLGGNGAGKSTLVKCIMGYYQSDQGAVLIANHERSITSTKDAHEQGLGMVYQHFTLVPNMTVLENLVLSRSPIPAVIRWQEEKQRLNALMAETPFRIPLDQKVNTLAAGEKQKVEILKQLFLQRNIIILDEPTSVLTPQEADEILGMLKKRTRSNNLTVLIITHKFREVMNFADAVTILRRGQVMYSGPLANKTPATLAELMIGSEEIAATGTRAAIVKGDIRLAIDKLVTFSDSGAIAVDGLSLKLRAGEILGIAGVSGNGQRELVEVLSGQRTPESGDIRVCGEPYRASREEMARHKINCLPEEPLRNACVPRMNLMENLALRIFDQAIYTRWRRFISYKLLRVYARDLIERYRIHPPQPERWIETLSGGNVQRLVLARELAGEVDILITANPCFGLDFA